MRFLVRYKSAVNRTTGAAMLALSVYFLVCDFHLFGLYPPLCDRLLPA